MPRQASTDIKDIGNENSYTPEFFEELFQKLDVKADWDKSVLKRTITLATQAYVRNYSNHEREITPSQIKKELKKAVKHIDKAAESYIKVSTSPYYSQAMVNNLFHVINQKYPRLHGMLNEIIRPREHGTITSPIRALDLLSAMAEGIESTIRNFEYQKTPKRSEAIYNWIMILSAKLEPLIGHKLEQSRYYKGEYISKRNPSDSELLLYIIKPLDPNVTMSQMETAIKETRKERHEAPWDDYFPM